MQSYTWIYSLKNSLEADTLSALQQNFDAFTDQWKTHGKPVDGLIQTRHNRFVIVQADPNVARPSGCSIDSLRRAVTGILQQAQLESLDASKVFYRDADGEIQYIDFREIPKALAQGQMTGDSIVFDNTLGQSDDLEKWELPLKATWLKRYLVTQS